MNSMTFDLGSLTDAVNLALSQAEKDQIVKRIWRKDASLWKTDEESQRLIRNSLGWLTVADEMLGVAEELIEYAQFIRQRGFRTVMVCGMGGSSLCPEVLRQTFPPRAGFPELMVLDSTDPDVTADLLARVDVEHCLFVVSSKSGSTIEPIVFYKFWYEQLRQHKPSPGENFVAITDPGSPMIQTASDLGFQRVFLNQPDIGGRYSALSYFGLVPAALAGFDIKQLLNHAKQMSQLCSAVMPFKANPGAQLGVALGECAKAGRDKLTLMIGPRVGSLGLWIEQLIAESTGKEGKGILPVAAESLADVSAYESDRLFVSITTGDTDEATVGALEKLAAAGHPVIQRQMNDVHELGAEFFVWEFATACACWRLGINPFDQPNVQEAKKVTVELLKRYQKDKQLPKQNELVSEDRLTLYADSAPAGAASNSAVATLRGLFDMIKAGDYVALLAFIEETPVVDELLQRIRLAIRDGTSCATTIGYGPRFLHSTGQLHKGGPNTGVFLQINADDAQDFPIPGEGYSFSVLKQAQAHGDFRALSDKGRRILGIDLHEHTVAGLTRLLDLVTEALATRSAATS